MGGVVLLASALLSCCEVSGDSQSHGPEKVQALVGGVALLPCSFSSAAAGGDDFPTVEWSKVGLLPDVVFLYRGHCEIHEMKNPVFEFRTGFVMRNLKHRDLSLRISNLRPTDAGLYKCKRLWEKKAPAQVTEVELVVGAVSEPKLLMMSAEGGHVTLECNSGCWLPEPDVSLVDQAGNDLTAEKAEERRREPDASGCFHVRRRVTLYSAPSRVFCKVQQLQLNQSRVTEIFVPASCMTPCHMTACWALGGVIVTLLAMGLAWFMVFLWWRRTEGADEKKGPVYRTESDEGTSESENLLGHQRKEDVGFSDRPELRERPGSCNRVVCQPDQPPLQCCPSRSSLDAPDSAEFLDSTRFIANVPQGKGQIGTCPPAARPRRTNSTPDLGASHDAGGASSEANPERPKQLRRNSMGSFSFLKSKVYSGMTKLEEEGS